MSWVSCRGAVGIDHRLGTRVRAMIGQFRQAVGCVEEQEGDRMSQVYNDYALGLRAAARMLGVSERTLQRYVRSGLLSCVKERQGNLEMNRFSFTELQEFLRSKYLARVAGDNADVGDEADSVTPVVAPTAETPIEP